MSTFFFYILDFYFSAFQAFLFARSFLQPFVFVFLLSLFLTQTIRRCLYIKMSADSSSSCARAVWTYRMIVKRSVGNLCVGGWKRETHSMLLFVCVCVFDEHSLIIPTPSLQFY